MEHHNFFNLMGSKLQVLLIVVLCATYATSAEGLRISGDGSQAHIPLGESPPFTWSSLRQPFCGPPFDIEGYVTNTLGLPFETHHIKSPDGYHLTLHRLPREGGKPVLFVHGTGGASMDMLAIGRRSLGAVLYEKGFDVWGGNMRGNYYSQGHDRLSTDDGAFWNFTVIDIGKVDLPVLVSHMLNVTKQNSVAMIGHSLGTSTIAAALASPWGNWEHLKTRINLAVLLTPILTSLGAGSFLCYQFGEYSPLTLYMKNTPYFNLCAEPKPSNAFESLQADLWSKMMTINHIRDAIEGMNTKVINTIGDVGFRMLMGNSGSFLGSEVAHQYFPAGVSTKVILHAAQQLKWPDTTFRDWDYGFEGNMQHYHQPLPPVLDLSTVKTPVALFFAGGSDPLVGAAENVEACKRAFPNTVFQKNVQRLLALFIHIYGP
eukprot:gnl/TRDRNA2_/TRDRNA2_174610_c0_seq4.p1 gnl/TRDRNA2_/TRDRNA2_174610_c0~~gnl/TRDRNA2_/TRDRNA2_174610_c0_seq4.p1  ORF type:complete len:431 (+),score=19.91 gnl/TRDRNA2_/TRDRNA2_174610_c0_seq4:76-1368(+)